MQSSIETPQRPAGPRAHRLRKVIESSPIAGDEDPIEDSENDDGPSEVPDSMANADDEDFLDDPQLDDRTREQFENEQSTSDDDDSDDDPSWLPETATFSDSDFEEITSELARGQPGSVALPWEAFQHIHYRYRHYLSELCSCSETRNLNDRMLAGLRVAAATAHELTLRDNHSSNPCLDRYAHALVIYVWISVLLFSSFNWQSLGGSLHLEFGSLLLCAHAILDEGEYGWKDTQLSVAYWQRQLKDKEAWLNWLRSFPPYPQPYQEADPTANEFLQQYDSDGLPGLGWFIIAKERDDEDQKTSIKEVVQNPSHSETACAELVAILLFVDDDLLKAIIQGRVFQQNAIREHPVRQALDALGRINKQPSIYMNAIADRMGISPAPCHWEEVCDHITMYLENDEAACNLAEEVDQLIGPVQSWPASQSKAGLRRYTDFVSSGSQERPRVNRHRRQMVRHFVSEMESRIQSERERGAFHIPFKAPVVEIGYSIDSKKRLKEHRNHRSSNYLMNLAEAMFQHLYPDLFPIQQAIIYACSRALQPWLGEILFTRLSQAYTYGARGFSHYPPGLSNSSACSHTPHRAWEHYHRETRADVGYQKRLEQLRKRTDENNKKRDEAVAHEIARLRSFEVFRR